MQIAFSGRLGSGKSTVCAILSEKYGYEIYSTGTVQRKAAEEMGISTLELNKRMEKDPTLDYIIDDTVAKLSREKAGENIVYDSRMAWHFAENTFKVYMYVDPTVAAKRVFAADRGAVEKYSSVEDAYNNLIERGNNENKRFKMIYKVDNYDYNNYNLIIDSTSATPEQIAEAIIEAANEFERTPFSTTRIKISPYVIYPTKPLGTDDGEEIEIALLNGKHYCVSGHSKLAALQLCGATFASAKLVSADVNENAEYISQYEASASFKYGSL